MKNLKIVFLFILGAAFLTSCSDDDERFTGSPVGAMPIETVNATVSTDASFALPGQTIKFTVTLPADFRAIVTDTVTVEASTFTLGGSVRRGTVDVLPGQDSATGDITVGGGGGTFDMAFDLKLTAISLKKEVPGKHYLIASNTINIASGNSSVPAESDNKLQMILSWENLDKPNTVRVKVGRVGQTAIGLAGASGSRTINVAGSPYVATFATNLTTTASNFVTNYAATILANSGITVTSSESAILFNYSTATPPVITTTGTGLAGSTIYSVDTQVLPGTQPTISKSFFVRNEPRVNPNTGRIVVENGTSAYGAGDYLVQIGATSANDLAVSPTDLKYRIAIRFPDGHVEIFKGTYFGMSVAGGFKPVLSFTKTGTGDASQYTNFSNLNP